jgi:hypothetical protein
MTVSPSGRDEGLPDAELTGPDDHLRVRGAERQQPGHLVRLVAGRPQCRTGPSHDVPRIACQCGYQQPTWRAAGE